MSWPSVKAPVPTPHGVKASEVEKDKIRPHLSDNVLLLKANLVKMEDFQILNCQTKPMGVIKWVKRPWSMLWRGGGGGGGGGQREFIFRSGRTRNVAVEMDLIRLFILDWGQQGRLRASSDWGLCLTSHTINYCLVVLYFARHLSTMN